MKYRTYKNIHGEYVTWGEDGSEQVTYQDFNGDYVTWQAKPPDRILSPSQLSPTRQMKN